MHAPGIWGIIIVAVVVLLLFGRGKISDLMGDVDLARPGLRLEEDGPARRAIPTPHWFVRLFFAKRACSGLAESLLELGRHSGMPTMMSSAFGVFAVTE